jgi:hypothetical protein
MKMKYLIISVFFIGALLISCEYTPFESEEIEISGPVDFDTDIAPIFSDAGCVSCHNGGEAPDLSAENAYQSLTSNAKYTDLNDPNNIYEKAKPGNDHKANYSAEQAAYVKAWVLQYIEEN